LKVSCMQFADIVKRPSSHLLSMTRRRLCSCTSFMLVMIQKKKKMSWVEYGVGRSARLNARRRLCMIEPVNTSYICRRSGIYTWVHSHAFVVIQQKPLAWRGLKSKNPTSRLFFYHSLERVRTKRLSNTVSRIASSPQRSLLLHAV
jgi:hypothetical protein